MCSEKFQKVLKDNFRALIKFFRKCQQFFISTFLKKKCPKSRRIWGMSRAGRFSEILKKSNFQIFSNHQIMLLGALWDALWPRTHWSTIPDTSQLIRSNFTEKKKFRHLLNIFWLESQLFLIFCIFSKAIGGQKFHFLFKKKAFTVGVKLLPPVVSGGFVGQVKPRGGV